MVTSQPINEHELEYARLFGMDLEDCHLEAVKFRNDTKLNTLRCLGLQKKQTQRIKLMYRTQEENDDRSFTAQKVVWKYLTDAFLGGQLDENRFEHFGKLEPGRMSDGILEGKYLKNHLNLNSVNKFHRKTFEKLGKIFLAKDHDGRPD